MAFSAAVINLAHVIQDARSRCPGQQCLAEELRQTLSEMQELLDAGQLDFVMVSGGKPSLLLRNCADTWRPPENLTEAYSLRMMASNVRNLGVAYFSPALDEEVRASRQLLLRNLQDLHALLTSEHPLPPPVPSVSSKMGVAAAIAHKRMLEKQKDEVLDRVLRDPDAAALLKQDDTEFWRLFEPLGHALDVGSLTAEQVETEVLTLTRQAHKNQALIRAQIQRDLSTRQFQAAQANSQHIVALVLEQQAQRPDFTELDAADCVLEGLNQSQLPDQGTIPLNGIRFINAAALRLQLHEASLQRRPLAILTEAFLAQQPTLEANQPAGLFCQTALWALAALSQHEFPCRPAVEH